MPLFALSVRTNAREAEATLDAIGRKQIPFAASQAVNKLARQAVADLQQEMRKVFDRPVPRTISGFGWRKSSKRSMSAEVFAKEFLGKGTPAWQYLTPEVFGGTRKMKRFERALAAIGGGDFAVPGRGAQLNRYGNIDPGSVEQLLSALGAAGGANQQALTREQRRARFKSGKRKGEYKHATYFIAHAKSDGAPLAIYRVVSSGRVEPVLVFSRRAPAYRKRLPYFETVEKSFNSNRDETFTRSLQEALATAK